jgi:hypothetical protein
VEDIKAITEAASRLKQMGCDIPDRITVLHLQNGLTSEWNSVRARYLNRKERNVSLQEMKILILQEILDPSRTSKPIATAQFASTGASGKVKFLGTCNHCQEVEHKEK